jgi:hypothetical protein
MAFDSYPDRPGLRYAVALVYSIVIATFWVPALLFRQTRRFLREAGTESWPRANGSITSVNIKVIHGWIVDYAVGQLDYGYKVASEYYAGSITRQYPDEQAAWNFVDARNGKAVTVRYKDDDAQVSALRDADQELSGSDGNDPRLLAMIWQHWRDELQGELVAGSDDAPM